MLKTYHVLNNRVMMAWKAIFQYCGKDCPRDAEYALTANVLNMVMNDMELCRRKCSLELCSMDVPKDDGMKDLGLIRVACHLLSIVLHKDDQIMELSEEQLLRKGLGMLRIWKRAQLVPVQSEQDMVELSVDFRDYACLPDVSDCD